MKTKKELKLLLGDTVLIPKMYSADKVRKILKFHDLEWQEHFKEMEDKWRKEYEDVTKYYDDQLIDQDEDRKAQLKTILELGHGGGNWRRLIEMASEE